MADRPDIDRLAAELREAREYCARPPGTCFDPALAEHGSPEEARP